MAASPPAATSGIRALLLTDVVDSTRLTQTLGDEATAALWAAHDRAARDLLPPHHGREIDKTDGMLLLFERAADALAYAQAYHRALAGLPLPLSARAGLHVGPVLLRENSAADIARGAKPLEVDGIAKPTAARVMALAGGGQTLLSAEARAALGEAGAALQSHGHWQLKGVEEPLEIFDAAPPPCLPLADGDKAQRMLRIGPRWLPVRQTPNNLPQQATSFHGRERELEEVKDALHASRLVTLLGMGGLGKTRLSLQVAAELLADHPDGAWFLDLSPLRDPALVVEEAARLLQVQDEPGRPLLQALCGALAEKRLLLVIDNCEHLIDAAAALAHALLRAAPQVHLLASSRMPLRVPGERTYALQPLAVPPAQADAAALLQLPAVQLFVERAQAHRQGFVLDAAQARAVAELVTRLEGIPLALELAAARVRSMSVADINARLKDRYKLLTGGSRVLQARQQTLRALVDWSHDLLTPAEQTLLRRLSVFAGGFDLAAAEAVCGTEPLESWDVVDLLDRLVEHSLVSLVSPAPGQEPAGDGAADPTRYTMLETLREYAHEKLAASGEAPGLGARHCAHYFGVAKLARDGLRGAEQPLWIRRTEADLDNLRAAMALARAGGADPLLAAKLPVALQGFWVLRGYLSEGREHLRAALALPAVQALDMARAHTLYVAAVLADAQGEPGQAEQLLEVCLALRRAANDASGVASTLSALAMARLATGQAQAAREAETEALALFQQLGHRLGEAASLVHLGHIRLHLGEAAAAAAQVGQALALARALNNLEAECECERLLGLCATAEGDAARAQAHLQRSWRRCREAGDRQGEAKAQAELGRLALMLALRPAWTAASDRAGAPASADPAALLSAQALMADALRTFQHSEMRAEIIGSVEDHATLAHALGQHESAACLLGAATQARRALGLPRSPIAQAHGMALREALQQQLGDWGWSVAEAAGAASSLGDAAQAALALALPVEAAAA